MARIIADWNIFPRGIAPDEKTAVCIEADGTAKVFGSNNAYFIKSDPARKPELCVERRPLQWYHNGKALKVYEIHGSNTGNGSFDLKSFDEKSAVGGKWYWWSVNNGHLEKKEKR